MKIGQISYLRLTTPADRLYGSEGLGSKYQGQTDPTASRFSQEFSGPGTPIRTSSPNSGRTLRGSS